MQTVPQRQVLLDDDRLDSDSKMAKGYTFDPGRKTLETFCPRLQTVVGAYVVTVLRPQAFIFSSRSSQ
ncbi:hypothetical protein EYF80_014738 [Liparis tanakae]|uniref:Uncharacterized protein n=1 Tax=Liparis tanakae TaxID=230148 RepID=A0A4Z2ID29_9TELE|nr:hypothetical protein EYF80_014738 [Liparis tanakae]